MTVASEDLHQDFAAGASGIWGVPVLQTEKRQIGFGSTTARRDSSLRIRISEVSALVVDYIRTHAHHKTTLGINQKLESRFQNWRCLRASVP
jgi:hypothetical protein